MKKHFIACTALSCAIASPSIAQDQSDWEAYLGGAWYFWDNDRDLDDGKGIDGGIEIPLDESLALEAWISDFGAETEEGGNDIDGRKYSLGGLYHFSDTNLRPFVSLGASHQELEPDGGDEADESLVYLGLGAKQYFENNLIVRAEAIAMNSLDNEFTDLGVRLAVGYAFGKGSTSKTATKTSATPSTELSAEPSPEPSPEPSAKPAATTPEATPITEVAEEAPTETVAAPAVAPKDSDGDGIIDSKDQCPDTDKAFQVNSEGCPMKLVETVTITMDVKFKTNSAEVASNETEITALADFLKRFPETKVEVQGHTDDRGAASYNKILSQKRADAVKSYLVDQYGIEAARIEATGYGEAQPIASNDSRAGRATNRRVIAKVSADYETVQTK